MVKTTVGSDEARADERKHVGKEQTKKWCTMKPHSRFSGRSRAFLPAKKIYEMKHYR